MLLDCFKIWFFFQKSFAEISIYTAITAGSGHRHNRTVLSEICLMQQVSDQLVRSCNVIDVIQISKKSHEKTSHCMRD